jgi:hypothetical protein
MLKNPFALAALGLTLAASNAASAFCSEYSAELGAAALYAEETGNRDGRVERIELIDASLNKWYAAVGSPREGEREIRFVFTMRRSCQQVDLSRILGDNEDAQ